MTPQVKPALLAAGALLAALLVLWLWPRGVVQPGLQGAEGWETRATALQQELVALQEALAEEARTQRILASEVELLREVLLELGGEIGLTEAVGDLLDDELADGSVAHSGDPGGPGDAVAKSAREASDETSEPKPAAKSEKPVFQFAELIEAGIHEIEADRVRDIWYQIELDKLELRDLAIREGWVNSKRYKRQLEGIRDDAFDELGECGYDSLLYGTGKNNRVFVRDVIEGSAAERAGLHVGDVVLRYDDSRVFAASDLQSATSSGVRGETVTVDVDRNGEKVYLRVERGPFGMFMRQGRGLPDGC